MAKLNGYFFIEHDNLLEKYNTIQDKMSSEIKKKKILIANLFTIKIFLKTKIKTYNDEARDFHDKEISQMGSNHTCLALIKIDFSLKKDENYYLQVFVKECKYIEKKSDQTYYL